MLYSLHLLNATQGNSSISHSQTRLSNTVTQDLDQKQKQLQTNWLNKQPSKTDNSNRSVFQDRRTKSNEFLFSCARTCDRVLDSDEGR